MSIENTARIIKTIPATVSNAYNKVQIANRKIRQCAYARVSTNSKEQLTSYETQCKYYNDILSKQPNTEYVGIFTDEAKSGKSINGRPGFQEMLKQCYSGKIDRIVTKSVSRFARNMVECLKTARELKERGITVYFESQGIDTKNEASFTILAMLAAIAEEDIRTMSSNIKWGVQKRYAEGKVHMSGTMYGYRIKKGKFILVEQEAQIIKELYEEFLKGKTINELAKQLYAKNIKSPRGKDKWMASTIINILQNEKYKGEVILQKTYKTDVLGKRQINCGQQDKYEVKNNHLPIVSKKLFDAVQTEFRNRELSKIEGTKTSSRYSSQYAFSTLIECSECGTKFRRHAQTHADKKVIVWVCANHQLHRDKCKMKPIKETAIEDAFVRAINEIVANKGNFIEQVLNNIKQVVKDTNLDDLVALKKELDKKQDELIQLNKISKQQQYVDDKTQEQALNLMDEITALNNNIKLLNDKKETKDLLELKLKEMKKLISNIYENFDASVFKCLIAKILVITNKRITFIFKTGIQIEQEI